jgi:carbon-monoxide dehydrogenase small subunit
MQVELNVNGEQQVFSIHPGETLLETLRAAGYTGVKCGCEAGDCGACLVLLNDLPVNACQVLTAAVSGERIVTIEGLGNDSLTQVLQQELVAAGGVQCGFCTPGIVISATALLRANPHPDRLTIQQALAGNLCRCTGYVKIIDGIENAARKL